MPEGDSVHRTAAALHSGLAGQQLLRSDFRVPALATVDLSGRTVLEAVSRGKHLLIRLSADPRTGSRAVTVHSHLMMEGRWELTAIARPEGRETDAVSSEAKARASGRGLGRARPQRSSTRLSDRSIRAVLETGSCRAVGVRVQQLAVVPTIQEQRLVGHLGPDLLDPGWSADHAREAVRRLLEAPQRPVASALMDQTRLAGIGSIYRCELLFRHRLAPQTPVGSVGDLAAVVEDARELLLRNCGDGPRMTTGDPRPGRRLWVYGRQHRPCWRCGTAIEEMTWDDAAGERDPRTDLPRPARNRPLFLCPRCQR